MDSVKHSTGIRLTGNIIGTLALCSVPPVFAEVTFDGSMGAPGTLQGANMEITADRGQIRGDNLFHSFSQFNINTGESANFSGPVNIQNIFGRVTGSGASNIDGTISSSITGANLFLINPNGIMFGPNTQINITGSFHATTADYIKLGNNERFYADLNQNTSLSVAAPSAFGFLDNNVADISVDGGSLSIGTGNTLSLVGGNIDIDNGATVNAPDGLVNLASTKSAGEFETALDQSDIDQFATLGRIHTSGDSAIDTSGNSGGKIVIRGGELVMDSSTITSTSNLFTNPFTPLKIDVGVRDNLTLDNRSSLKTSSNFSANSGNILINAGNLVILNQSTVDTATGLLSSGNAGDIEINSDNVTITGLQNPKLPEQISPSGDFTGIHSGSGIFNSGDSGNFIIRTNTLILNDNATIRTIAGLTSGLAGEISIETNNVQIRNGSKIQTGAAAQSGNITINASDTVSLDGIWIDNTDSTNFRSSSVFSTSGAIDISAKTFDMTNGANLATEHSLSVSASGDISINAETINIDGFNQELYSSLRNIGTVTEQEASRAARSKISTVSAEHDLAESVNISGGDVIITANDFSLTDGAILTTQSKGSTDSSTHNDAGSISITTKKLSISNGSAISSSSLDGGNAGDINIVSDNLTMLQNSTPHTSFETGIFSTSSSALTTDLSPPNINIDTKIINLGRFTQINSQTNGKAQGGNISLNSQLLHMDKAAIQSSSTSTGNAGIISITGNTFELKNGSLISTQAETASGGEIILISERKISVENSSITSLVSGSTGDAGDVTLSSNAIILNKAKIITSAVGGIGGDININSNYLIKSANTVLNASSELSVDGQINIGSLNDITNELENLPDKRIDTMKFIRNSCGQKYSHLSSLVASKETTIDPKTYKMHSIYNINLLADYGNTTPELLAIEQQKDQNTPLLVDISYTNDNGCDYSKYR